MLEAIGDMFDELGTADAIFITTNGFVKRNGRAVMGRGCAKQARDRWPEVERTLGEAINQFGNIPHILITDNGTQIWSFPVKPVYCISSDNGLNVVQHMRNQYLDGANVPGWACVADLSIICQSVMDMIKIADASKWTRVVLPRPGCGAGELSWDKVRPALAQLLDNRFAVYTYA
jgi:hypothetical protein